MKKKVFVITLVMVMISSMVGCSKVTSETSNEVNTNYDISECYEEIADTNRYASIGEAITVVSNQSLRYLDSDEFRNAGIDCNLISDNVAEVKSSNVAVIGLPNDKALWIKEQIIDTNRYAKVGETVTLSSKDSLRYLDSDEFRNFGIDCNLISDNVAEVKSSNVAAIGLPNGKVLIVEPILNDIISNTPDNVK